VLWGIATPSEIVRVSFIGRIYLAIADPKSGEYIFSIPLFAFNTALCRVSPDCVSAGKWRVCIDTSNVLGGPFQMVFTTNGIRQLLDNVCVPQLRTAILIFPLNRALIFRFVGNTPSSCPNDAQHSVTSAYPCEAFAYPTRWTSSASVCAPPPAQHHHRIHTASV
jgi:hypothetical protein